jgi:hypothetical protein
MKITKSKLKQIIKEELKLVLRTRPYTDPLSKLPDEDEKYYEVQDDNGDIKGRVEYNKATHHYDAFDSAGQKMCYQPREGMRWGSWKTAKAAAEAVLHGETCDDFFEKVKQMRD